MGLLIRGGRVIDPRSETDARADVLIEDQRITRVEPGIAAARQVVDARDMLVLPGLVDLHVHLREPGQTHKEDIASGSRAAVAGGVTSLCCMPNTEPVNDSPAVTRAVVQRAREVALCRVYPVAAITRGLAGADVCDFESLIRAGAVAFSDDGRCVMDSGVMRRALERARAAGRPVIQHCEDHQLSAGGAMNEGPRSRQLGLSGQPSQAESMMVARDLELVQLTGARYHVAHLSTAEGVEHVRRAKARGLPVTCEVAPHHFTLTDERCGAGDPLAKVNPPLRSQMDLEAVRAALADGTVDAIATDHAPHSTEEKQQSFEAAPFGISGIETLLPLALALWREGVVPLQRLVALMSAAPARLMGLEAGGLAPGAPADVIVVDPDARWVVEPSRFQSRGHNTPFAGRQVQGRVVLTVMDGRIVWDARD